MAHKRDLHESPEKWAYLGSKERRTKKKKLIRKFLESRLTGVEALVADFFRRAEPADRATTWAAVRKVARNFSVQVYFRTPIRARKDTHALITGLQDSLTIVGSKLRKLTVREINLGATRLRMKSHQAQRQLYAGLSAFNFSVKPDDLLPQFREHRERQMKIAAQLSDVQTDWYPDWAASFGTAIYMTEELLDAIARKQSELVTKGVKDPQRLAIIKAGASLLRLWLLHNPKPLGWKRLEVITKIVLQPLAPEAAEQSWEDHMKEARMDVLGKR